ncbi:MAG: Ig-like domain-containing protein [Gammaproteobacteria bacterium]|nr:Ig-like domain-containing protein [Gammaproteobacteria bacterium]
MSSERKLFFSIVGIWLLFLQACNNNDDVDKFLQASDAARLDLASVSISADRVLVNAGEDAQFSALGVRANSTTVNLTESVEWRSSDPSLVSIDSQGLAHAKADGNVLISAHFAHLQTSLDFRVNTAELVSVNVEGAETFDECLTRQLSASGEYNDGSERPLVGSATWAVSNGALASVEENTDGALLKTHQAGAVQVTAVSQGVTGSLDVEILDTLQTLAISPRDITLSVDDSRRFTATGTYSDGTLNDISASTTWSSADESIASFDSQDAGLLTAKDEGTTSLSANCGGQSDSTTLTTQVVEIEEVEIRPDQSRITLDVGDDGYQLSLRAVNTDGSTEDVTEDAEWSKLSPSSVTIQVSNRDGSKGELSISGTGNATVEARYEGFSDSILVVVE